MTKDIPTVTLANRVLGFVDECEKHGNPDEESHNHEEKATNQFQRAKDGFNLDPCS